MTVCTKAFNTLEMDSWGTAEWNFWGERHQMVKRNAPTSLCWNVLALSRSILSKCSDGPFCTYLIYLYRFVKLKTQRILTFHYLRSSLQVEPSKFSPWDCIVSRGLRSPPCSVVGRRVSLWACAALPLRSAGWLARGAGCLGAEALGILDVILYCSFCSVVVFLKKKFKFENNLEDSKLRVLEMLGV